MDMIDRLLKTLKYKGITGTQVAQILSLKKTPLTDWKNRHSKPTLDQIILLCEHLALSADSILLGKENISNISESEKQLIENYRLLQRKEKYKVSGRIETYLEEYTYADESDNADRYINTNCYIKEKTPKNNIAYLSKHREMKYDTELWGNVSKGNGIYAIPSREKIRAPVKCDFALRIVGNSMEPLYYDQQIIYLKQKPDMEQGQIAAVQIDDNYIPVAYLKKVYKEKSHIRLVSINPSYEDKILPAEKVRILGIVIEK